MIFHGRAASVRQVDSQLGGQEVTFEVFEQFQGEARETVQVFSGDGSLSCGTGFPLTQTTLCSDVLVREVLVLTCAIPLGKQVAPGISLKRSESANLPARGTAPTPHPVVMGGAGMAAQAVECLSVTSASA